MSYTSKKRLYLSRDGEVVAEGDERAATLLVGEGGQLSDADAAKYGLTGKAQDAAEAAPAEAKPQRAPAAKAVAGSQGNK